MVNSWQPVIRGKYRFVSFLDKQLTDRIRIYTSEQNITTRIPDIEDNVNKSINFAIKTVMKQS